MRQRLTLHPASRCDAILKIEIEAEMAGPRLSLRYVASGRIGEVKIPALSGPDRTDGLWKSTCFEAFIGSDEGDAYYEFNFAASTQWASYRFASYREGMTPALETIEPDIQTRAGAGGLDLRGLIDLRRLGALPGDESLLLGVAAVIEETSGALSYWALAHPRGKPDFHHKDGFVLELTREK